MKKVNAYAAFDSHSPLKPFQIERREPGAHDVVIDIEFCGICHSDLHQVKNEWSGTQYPIVPGHEIVGTVAAVGSEVSRFQKGERVGVGCFVDSCRKCQYCRSGLEQYCQKGMNQTYNSVLPTGERTFGGYSKSIVVDENYVLTIPENLSADVAAPLLCAGITTYSPLMHWKVNNESTVGVIGLGGLGHMAVKLAKALGAKVAVFSSSDKKKADALQFGASEFVNTTNPSVFNPLKEHFDVIINTAPMTLNLEQYLNTLKPNGTMVLVGAPEKPLEVPVFPLIMKRRQIAGSLIGGIKETQEMLDFCSKENVFPTIEIIPIDQVNEAYERMLKNDVRYRFVIDLKTLTT